MKEYILIQKIEGLVVFNHYTKVELEIILRDMKSADFSSELPVNSLYLSSCILIKGEIICPQLKVHL